MNRKQAEANIGATVIIKSTGGRASLHHVLTDVDVVSVVHFPQDSTVYWGRYNLKEIRLADEQGSKKSEWILTDDRLPPAAAEPYRCKPVIALVVGAGENFEDTFDYWFAIRCMDTKGVERWYGLSNDGHTVDDPVKYELISDESVLSWKPWPVPSA